jgi:hypothetical protein
VIFFVKFDARVPKIRRNCKNLITQEMIDYVISITGKMLVEKCSKINRSHVEKTHAVELRFERA